MKAVDLARLSGVGQPMISRYIAGENTWLSLDDLGRLAQAISNIPSEQAELIRAHLLDECRGPGSDKITIAVSGQHRALQEAQAAYTVKLPDELERHFAVIREWVIKDRNVREVIEGLGNLLGSGDCRVQLQDSPAPIRTELVNQLGDDIVQGHKREIIAAREEKAKAAASAGTSGKSESAPAPAPGAAPTPPAPAPSDHKRKRAPARASRKGKT